MGLVELARQLADLAQAREQLARLPLDNVDLRVVLVDHEHQALSTIARQGERNRGAAALLDLAVSWRRDGLPRQVDVALEAPHFVIKLNARAGAIADINRAVVSDGHAMHGVHAFRLPLAQEVAAGVEHHDAAVALLGFTIGDVNVTILAIDMDAGWRVEAR